ncbi:MAG: DUF4270 domain-containing protein [Bacteroidetes bacterium]|nr:DUF4270 domain-containing protein [Bacteroidota bacterium]
MQSLSRILQFRLLLVFGALMLFSQCQKDPSVAGPDNGDFLERIDTLASEAYTVLIDAENAKNQNDVALGKVVDSRFGTSMASFYSQLRLTTNSFTPGANAVLDSAVLVIAIESVYGNMDVPLDIEVYRLEEELVSETSYTNNLSLSVGSTLIGALDGYTYPDDAASIRIPMSAAFASELFGLFGTSTTESSDNFLAYLDGIYVSIDPATGGDGHLDLDLTNANSALNLYFRSDNANDSIYSFVMDEQAIRLNKYEHDFSSSELQAAIDDPSTNEENILLSGFGVSKARVYLPDLSVLQGKIINQAKLSFYQTDYNQALANEFDVPEYLFLSGGIEGDSIQYTLTDYSSTDPTAYGGTIQLKEVNGSFTNVYTYSLPRFLQRVVNEETTLEYLVLEVLNNNNAARVKLGGGSHPDLPIKLEILYTKP